jgi:radical SAM protein with 4Fe4S-binding SPASM domain
MVDIIVSVVLVAILGGAVWYIRKAKKRGEHCIGCPHSKQCGGECSNSDK